MKMLFQDTGLRILVLSNFKVNPTLLVVHITVLVVTKTVNTLTSKDPLSNLLKMEAVVLISFGMVLPMAKNCHSIWKNIRALNSKREIQLMAISGKNELWSVPQMKLPMMLTTIKFPSKDTAGGNEEQI